MQSNGLLRVVSSEELVRREREAADAVAAEQSRAQDQLLFGLAGYLTPLWEDAKRAKNEIRPRMLQSLRQRRGEYEPDKLAKIRDTGGSEIYMQLTSLKCRAAGAWLRDAVLGQGSDKPWTISPTPSPDLPSGAEQELMTAVGQEVGAMAAAGVEVPPDVVRERIDKARDAVKTKLREVARQKALDTERVLEDQLVEGGYYDAMEAFIDDFVTYPAAILKGPVVHSAPVLSWQKQGDSWSPVVETQLVKRWYRIDPFKFYPAPWAADIEDGYCFEHHRLTPESLYAMIGAPGYSEPAIREVIRDGANLRHWLGLDWYNSADRINQPNQMMVQNGPMDALEFYGPVPGRHLMEWGIDDPQVTDHEKSYNVNVWMIGRHIIKATVNPDPLGKKPYRKGSYEEIPGAFWGNTIPDLIRDTQDVCNNTARALVNNMAIASGPQVWINIDRMPAGASVTSLYPWKIHQTEESPMGNTAPPMDFFQPSSNAQELLAVFQFFSMQADEFSGLPRYMTGDGNVGGAGRTSSGLSMLMNSASKLMKQVMGSIDRITADSLISLHAYLMQFEYERFPELAGDVRIVARGATAVVQREQLQLRRNEFLMATANPLDSQIMGPQGRAYLLREMASRLDLDTDRIVPEVPQAMPQAPGQPGQPGVGGAPGQPGQPAVGGPAAMGDRPPGATMDAPRMGG